EVKPNLNIKLQFRNGENWQQWRQARDLRRQDKGTSKLQELARDQATLEHETDKTRSSLEPLDKDLALDLSKAEELMQAAKNALDKAEPQKAMPAQEDASKKLQDVRKGLDDLIAKHKKDKDDPLKKLQAASDDLASILQNQKQARDDTKAAAANP